MLKPSVIANPSRSLVELDKASATEFDKYDVIAKAANGLVEPADSSTERSEVVGIANKEVVSADAETDILAHQIFEHNTYIADTTNNSDTDHTGQRMVLTNAGEVNNTGTDNANGIVQQVDVFGDPADKKIVVEFV